MLQSHVAKRILDAAPSPTVVIGVDGRIRWVSASLHRYLGYDVDAVAGTSVVDWIHPDDVVKALDSLALVDPDDALPHLPMIFRLRHVRGHYVDFDIMSINLLLDPIVEALVLNLRWAGARTQLFEPVRAIAAGASSADVLTLIATMLGRSAYTNRPTFVLSGRDASVDGFRDIYASVASEGLTEAITDLCGDIDDDRWRPLRDNDLMSLRVDELPGDVAGTIVAAGYVGLRVGRVMLDAHTGRGIAGLLVVCEPPETWHAGVWPPALGDFWMQLIEVATIAFQRDQVHGSLRHAATHDPMTGLANRAHFFDEMDVLRQRGTVSVLYIDVDNFKPVNDIHGHTAGDHLLIEIGRRLQSSVRPTDLTARLGGDEFAIALVDLPDARIGEVVDRIRRTIAEPLPSGCGIERISVSIGVAEHDPTPTSDQLVDRADGDLLAAKRRRHAPIRSA